jgi:hypothetical protein
MAEVEVGLGTILGDEDFAVLKRLSKGSTFRYGSHF